MMTFTSEYGKTHAESREVGSRLGVINIALCGARVAHLRARGEATRAQVSCPRCLRALTARAA